MNMWLREWLSHQNLQTENTCHKVRRYKGMKSEKYSQELPVFKKNGNDHCYVNLTGNR